jgi:hypothetical protein
VRTSGEHGRIPFVGFSQQQHIAAEAESRQGKSEIVSALCSLDDEREISSLAVYRYGEHV